MMRLITALLFGILGISASQAKDTSPRLVLDLSRAYGFIVAQNSSLDRIEREFPALRSEVHLTRARFGAKFGNIASDLENALRSLLKDKFTRVDADLRTKIAENESNVSLGSADARTFLRTVDERAAGAIPDTFLQPMLIARYQGNTLREFTEGWRQTFTTNGEGKALGVKIRLELPKSYGSKESPRPHILRNWTSEAGTGLDVIMLDVRDLGARANPEDVDEEIAKEIGVEAAGSEGELLEYGKFRQETYHGTWVSIIREEERATLKIKVGMLYYTLYVGDKAVSLGCTTAAESRPGADLKTSLAELKPLCLQVLNTLVLPNAYN